MKTQQKIIDEFVIEFESAKEYVKKLAGEYSKEDFLKNPAPGKWNAGDCLSHLNQVNTLYIKNANEALTPSEKSGLPDDRYKSRFLISKFINMMKPGNKVKFKTPAKFVRLYDGNLEETINNFLKVQDEFIDLAERSRDYNLAKVKISSPVSKLLNFQLGETLMFLIEHQKRHLTQAVKA